MVDSTLATVTQFALCWERLKVMVVDAWESREGQPILHVNLRSQWVVIMNEFGQTMAYDDTDSGNVDKERQPTIYIVAWRFPFMQIQCEIVFRCKITICRKGKFRNQVNQCQLVDAARFTCRVGSCSQLVSSQPRTCHFGCTATVKRESQVHIFIPFHLELLLGHRCDDISVLQEFLFHTILVLFSLFRLAILGGDLLYGILSWFLSLSVVFISTWPPLLDSYILSFSSRVYLYFP